MSKNIFIICFFLLAPMIIFSSESTSSISLIFDELFKSRSEEGEVKFFNNDCGFLLMELAKSNASQFVASKTDCREVPDGPMVSLEPKGYYLFRGERATCLFELFEFSKGSYVFQIRIDSMEGERKYYKWSYFGD